MHSKATAGIISTITFGAGGGLFRRISVLSKASSNIPRTGLDVFSSSTDVYRPKRSASKRSKTGRKIAAS